MKKLAFLLLLLLPVRLSSQSCQISSPLPMPVSIQGCTYNSNLPGGSTSYIQNSSTLQAGATAYPDFLYIGSSATIGNLGLSTATVKGEIILKDGTIITSTSTLGGSGGGGTPGGSNGQVQFNDGGTFNGDAALAYSSTTATGLSVSTITVGNVQMHTVFDNTNGIPAYKLVFQPLVDTYRTIQFFSQSGANFVTIDSNEQRVGIGTNGPQELLHVAGNMKVSGQTKAEGGFLIRTDVAPFAYQGTIALTSGSAVIPSPLVKTSANIFLTTKSASGTVGTVYVSSITANVSINILSTNVADNSTVSWLMIDTQ